MLTNRLCGLLAVACAIGLLEAKAESVPDGQTFRLHEGVTAFVANPDGKDFTVRLARYCAR